MKRIVSALVGIPLVMAAVFLSGKGLFLGIVVLLLLAALREYLHLCGIGGAQGLAALSAGVITVVASAGGEFFFAAGAGLLLVLCASLWRVGDPSERFGTLGEAFLGMVYLSYGMTCLYRLRLLPDGAFWLVLILVIIWSGDTAAYYGGSRFGKRRFAPVLSPGKTWAGAGWGLAGSIAAGITVLAVMGRAYPLHKIVVVAVMVALSGQLGDLLQSMWKRAKGVKDSGQLIPGHGGILDRIDSLLLGLPVGYHVIHGWGL